MKSFPLACKETMGARALSDIMPEEQFQGKKEKHPRGNKREHVTIW